MVKSSVFVCQILVLQNGLFSSPSYVVMPAKLVQLAMFIVILHFHFSLLLFLMWFIQILKMIYPDMKLY